jgi:putative transposase
MPWNHSDQVNERLKFVAALQTGTESMTEVCRRFGISRKTGYKILQRYEEEGPGGLRDRDSAPGRHPNRTPREVEGEILRVRKAHPTWGSKKILTVLASRISRSRLPARSTVDAILSRHGLVEPRSKRRRCPARLAPVAVAEQPNDGWSIDYKGWFRVGDGTRCDPLTVNDVASRMSLKLQALVQPRSEDVQRILAAAFGEYGLPRWILSDNGPPFGSSGLGGLTRLRVWLLKIGVTPVFIQPGHPEQNGRHERFHLTLKREAASPPSPTIASQQARFTKFRRIYNEERPHEALGMAVPASVYEPSPREMPSKHGDFEYGDTAEVRRVRSDGTIKWNGALVFVGSAMRDELVGIEPVGVFGWHVYLGPLRLGVLVEDKNVIVPLE